MCVVLVMCLCLRVFVGGVLFCILVFLRVVCMAVLFVCTCVESRFFSVLVQCVMWVCCMCVYCVCAVVLLCLRCFMLVYGVHGVAWRVLCAAAFELSVCM